MLKWHEYIADGPTLLLLPAFPFSNKLWSPVVEKFRGSVSMLVMDYPAFDNPGLESSMAWTFSLVSEGIKKKIDQLSIQQIIPCGVSMGGYAALDFTTRFSDRVEKLILVNTQASNDTDEAREKRHKEACMILNGERAEFTEGFLKKVFEKDKVPSDADVRFLKEIMDAQPATAIINALVAMSARINYSDRLYQIKAPTLIVTGSGDQVISPDKSHEMFEKIENADILTLKAGHLTPVEVADEFVQNIKMFITQN